MEYDEAERLMKDAGTEHGLSAASWYFNGNTTEETYRQLLRGVEGGDPEILDTFPSSPLSGEWADEPTPTSVFRDVLGLDLHAEASFQPEVASGLLDAYEDAFYRASADAIEREARQGLKK